MEIKPTYVTFEQAKWLKEIGFDEICNTYYSRGGIFDMDYLPRPIPKDLFYAPEQHEVVEWLFNEHDIDVSVYGKLPYIVFPDSEYGEGELQWHFEYRIIQNKDGQKCEVIEPKTWFESKQEAYSAAFDYILKELI